MVRERDLAKATQLKCPLLMNKHNRISLSYKKEDEVLKHAAWTNLETLYEVKD